MLLADELLPLLGVNIRANFRSERPLRELSNHILALVMDHVIRPKSRMLVLILKKSDSLLNVWRRRGADGCRNSTPQLFGRAHAAF